nr:hypothetical protein [uncultured Cohaesibacter sp.]
MNTQPIIRISEEQSATSRGFSDAVTAGMSPAFSAFSKAADAAPLDDQELLGVLHFRLFSAKQAKRRSKWFIGRIYNRFSGEQFDYIPLSGTHLRQVLKLADISPPVDVTSSAKCHLRVDVAQDAYNALERIVSDKAVSS